MIDSTARSSVSDSAAATDLDELGSQIVSLAGRLAAATCRWLLLVAEFDARDGRAAAGMASTAHWLAWSCGLSQRTARDHVRVARTLAAHPLLVTEMSAGRLSYSHVRAISRTVGADESRLVDDLVNLARHGTVQQVESTVRGLRTVRDLDDATQPPEERISLGWTAASQWRLSARFDPKRGALVESALDAFARTHGVSRPEALVLLAEAGLAALADEGKPPRELRGDERAAVVIHLDADAGRPARVANGPGLPDAVVKRLACAGRVRTIVSRRHAGGRREPLDVGRSHRLVTERQLRALRIRDGGCAHPGCGTRRNVEAHHVRHWLDGGRTDMRNLVLLCRRHHHQLHDGEFGIVPLGRGRFRFVRRGRALAPPPVDVWGSAAVEDEHPVVAADAATTRWDGSRLDRDWAVTGLARRFSRVA